MTLPLPPHISYSSWRQFEDPESGCQHRWMLDNAEGLKSQIFSIHMDFGTACHGAIERHKTRKSPVDAERAVKIFRKYFSLLFHKNSKKYAPRDLEYDEKKYAGPKDFFLAAGEQIIRRLDECDELREAEVLHNEYPLYEPIDRTDGIDVKFKGFIDLLIRSKDGRGKPVLYICDFKTCSFGWDREKREDRLTHYQIFLYKHFLCKKFNIDPAQVRCAFVLLKKRPPKNASPVEFFKVSAGPISVQRAIDALNSSVTRMADGLREGSLRKNRTACVSVYGDTCVYYNTNRCLGTDVIPEDRLRQAAEKAEKKKAKPKLSLDELRAKVIKKGPTK